MRSVFALLVCWSALILTLTGANASQHFPTLSQCVDPRLQENLEQQMDALGLDRAVRQKQLCVALVDVTDVDRPRMASLNGDHMMYAASLPKIAILLGAFQRMADGDMQFDGPTRQALEQMIRHSSNRAATDMLNRVGNDYLARVLQAPEFRLYDPRHNGGLWVGKAYGKGPAWQRDPLHNISHGATAFQVARFYYLLATDRLVSKPYSQQIKQILSAPAINHKFVKGLQLSCPDAQIYRKSGTWRQYHADSALIEHEGSTYIAVALADNPNGSRWLCDLIVAMDRIVRQ